MIMQLIISSLLLYTMNLQATLDFKAQKIDNKTIHIKVFFDLQNQALLYKDSIDFSIDTPEIQLSDWHSSSEPVSKYDEISKKSKIVFDKSTTIALYAIKSGTPTNQDSYLHLTYQTNQESSPRQKLFKLPTEKSSDNLIQQRSIQNNSKNTVTKKNFTTVDNKGFINSARQTWTSTISHLVEHTNSMPMRLILVFFLGVLLSLTPCIYPMIPITAGVLQSQQSNSLFYNFLLSLTYTLGVSTTFASFGLLASYTGPIYGKLLIHPISVIILVSFLGYMALSLFGLYNLYIPGFLQRQHTTNQGGSFLSCFLFGVASGSIASPCVSPGLILLLSVVATLGSSLLGFLLLFFFGVGLSTPLLIVGTFSNSLNLLPKAGLWMEEVKKLFGIMLLGVCFYYLSNILALTTIYYLIAITVFIIGIYYLYAANKAPTKRLRQFHNFFGTLLIALAIARFAYTYQEAYYHSNNKITTQVNWITNYQQALNKAKQQNTLLFIDFWAEYCSICRAIDSSILSDTTVTKLFKKIVPVKIDGTNDTEEPYNSLKKQYEIIGFPTFLLIDPSNQKVLKRWNSDLYHIAPQEFIDEVRSHIQNNT